MGKIILKDMFFNCHYSWFLLALVYKGWFESDNMFLLEFPSMGESGSRNEIITDTQVSVSLVITTYPPIVCKSSSTNIHVTTQTLSESGTNANMAVFDHKMSFMGNATERLGHTLKAFTYKNSKVRENGNHSDNWVNASQSDFDGSPSDEDDHHWQHQTHSTSS